MVRRRAVPGAVVVIVAAAAIAAIAVLGERDGTSVSIPVGEDGVAVRMSLSPRGYLFGDVVTAQIDLVVDRERLDPDAVRVETTFAPFLETRTELEQVEFGRDTRLRYRFSLECLEPACVPDGIEKAIQLPPAIVRVHGREVVQGEWPLFLIGARVREQGIAATAHNAEWHASPVLRAPTYRIEPTALAVVLALGAAALLGLALVALSVAVRGTSLRRRRQLSPLERALAVLEQARADRNEEEQRLALDRLADELRARGARELAGSAYRLAWAERSPAGDRTDALAERVRELIAGRSNGRV